MPDGGQTEKGRYTYYHCTEGRGRCADPYVREEKLIGEMAARSGTL
jgi:hypothetical protein